MPQAIKTVKIASRNCLFLKVSGEILWPKGNRIEWVSSVLGFRVCFSPYFLTVDENTRVWLRDPKGKRSCQVHLERPESRPKFACFRGFGIYVFIYFLCIFMYLFVCFKFLFPSLFLCSLELSWLFWRVNTLQPA